MAYSLLFLTLQEIARSFFWHTICKGISILFIKNKNMKNLLLLVFTLVSLISFGQVALNVESVQFGEFTIKSTEKISLVSDIEFDLYDIKPLGIIVKTSGSKIIDVMDWNGSSIFQSGKGVFYRTEKEIVFISDENEKIKITLK